MPARVCKGIIMYRQSSFVHVQHPDLLGAGSSLQPTSVTKQPVLRKCGCLCKAGQSPSFKCRPPAKVPLQMFSSSSFRKCLVYRR